MPPKTIISVIIPVYNRPALASKAIESALVQSGEFDLEILVVDDGSTDGSSKYLRDHFGGKITLLEQLNLGACAARNNGIDSAKGDYIALLDSDDHFLPGHLQRSLQVVSENPQVATYSQVIMDRGSGVEFLKPNRALREGELVAEYLLCEGGFIPTPTLFMASEVARTVRYRDGLMNGQDIDFAIRLQLSNVSLKMLGQPGAKVSDEFSLERISAKSNTENRLEWLRAIEPHISVKAAWGFRGWLLAKSYAQDGRYIYALSEFVGAFCRGVYPIGLSARIFIQIILPKKIVAQFKNVASKIVNRLTA